MSFSQRWQTMSAICQRRACRGVIHISCEYWAVNRKRCFACCVYISVDKYCKTLIINRQLSPVMVEKYVYKAGIKVLSGHCGRVCLWTVRLSVARARGRDGCRRQLSPLSKEGFPALRTRLVCVAKKPSLPRKQGFFLRTESTENMGICI